VSVTAAKKPRSGNLATRARRTFIRRLNGETRARCQLKEGEEQQSRDRAGSRPTMSWLTNLPPIARVRRALETRAHEVWNRDRTELHGLAALANRSFRIAFHAIRGILTHRLGLQAAALSYYTVFALVPTLVVGLWILRSVDVLPVLSPNLPARVLVPTGNPMLQAMLEKVMVVVDRATELAGGIVGLAALLFAVSKMFGYTERALHIIAASGQRTPKFSRALAYVALLFIPPAALAISGVSLFMLRASPDNPLSRLIARIPGFEVALGFALAFAALWLAVTLLYTAAARARIPFSSAAVGGALAALSLVVISWAFGTFQIGVSHASPVTSGFLAFPVFLVWAKASWYAVLVGAEVAVSHRVDRVLARGAVTFRLDSEGERRAGIAIMLQLTREAERAPGRPVPEDELARALRLPPAIVRQLSFRLVQRGLLAENVDGFSLRADPTKVTFDTVADAIDRDPALDRFDVHLPVHHSRLN
jgi:membrane protein